MVKRNGEIARIAEPAPKKGAKRVPFDFVLDELASLNPTTRPMFGCTAVYVGEKIVLVLRQKDAPSEDNGVWLATTHEHHEALRKDFPNMRSITVFGDGGPSGWQVLHEDDEDFEEAALRACALVREGDARIGKVPKSKSAKKTVAGKATAKKTTAKKR